MMSPSPDPARQPDETPHRQFAPMPRFAVLPLAPDGRSRGYVVYDRQTQRITNGVYVVLAHALANAASAELYGSDVPNMTPDAEALGLLFPPPRKTGRLRRR